MTKQFNDSNTWEAQITVEQARELAGQFNIEDLDIAIDEAQALVFTGEQSAARVIIIITDAPFDISNE
jgi:hypothetical protein